MKEHVQEPGIRKWAGDDLVELQNEPLSALQAMVAPYAPCILQGCEVSLASGSNYKLSAGMAALKGVDAQGKACVKIVRVEEVPSTVLPVYLYLGYETSTRVYASNEDRPVAYDYVAKVSTSIPEAESYLVVTTAGGQRLPDTMSITKKLDSDGGEAKDVKVSFTQASSRSLPSSGSRLGALMGSIRKWLYDLKALAFKDKVAGSDLDADVVATFNKKVDKKAGYALSKNDFTDALLDKLNGIAANANNYALPLASSSTRGGIKIGYSESSNNRAVKLSSEKAYVNIPNASSSSPGLMTSSDKSKLDNLDGGAVRFTSLNISMSNANPIGGAFNPTDSATLYNQGIRAGDLLFYNINGNMSEFCVGRVLSASSSKVVVSYMDDTSIPNQYNRLFPKYNVVNAYSNGLMASSDKSKLDGIATGANKTVVDSALSSSSSNPVRNSVIYNALNGKASKFASISTGSQTFNGGEVGALSGTVTISIGSNTNYLSSPMTMLYSQNATITFRSSGCDIYVSQNVPNNGTANMGFYTIVWYRTNIAFVDFARYSKTI